jgi:hypothetical protein
VSLVFFSAELYGTAGWVAGEEPVESPAAEAVIPVAEASENYSYVPALFFFGIVLSIIVMGVRTMKRFGKPQHEKSLA